MSEVTRQEFSDLAATVKALEARLRGQRQPTPEAVEGLEVVYLSQEYELAEESTTGTTAVTDWANAGAEKYIPQDALFAIVWAGIRDTNQGVGTSAIEARGGGVVRKLSEIWEDSSGASASGFSETWVPVTGGRFDWRISELGSGATWIKYRIAIIGYVRKQ